MRNRWSWGLVALTVAGCGGATAPRKTAVIAVPQGSAPACGRAAPGVGATRLGDVRSSSAVALATLQGVTYAYVADGDEPTLHTIRIDGDERKEVATTELAGLPEHVMVLGDGRVAVTLRRENQVQILEPTASPDAALTARCAVSVAVDPVAMASTNDDAAILVTSGWSHTLTMLDGVTLEARGHVDVPREPRAVVVDDDGKRAYVAHLVGAKMSVVDLADFGGAHAPRELKLAAKQLSPAYPNQAHEEAKQRFGCQGYALAKSIELPESPTSVVEEKPLDVGTPKPVVTPKPVTGPTKPASVRGRVFAPMVTVDPGDPGRIAYYGNSDGLATELPQVPVVDAAAERVLTRSMLASRRGFVPRDPDLGSECLLPRAAAVHGASLYVACLGIDSLVELDARALDPARTETRRWAVGAGPTGLAIDAAHDRAIVWSQFDRTLSVVDLTSEKAPARLALSRRSGFGLVGDIAQGRVLFHKTGDPRISTEGMACASCHPEGREDSITWGTQDGPRQTIMLSGRLADTGPYSWNGAHKTVTEHVVDTMSRLRGSGLRTPEIVSLVSYIEALSGPNVGAPPLTADRAALVAQGKDVFASAEAACSTCHNADTAFADGKTHDVEGVPSMASRALETPSLRFVSGTAPYFHDGRYPTLGAMLDASDHVMGHPSSLPRERRVALEAYLETL